MNTKVDKPTPVVDTPTTNNTNFDYKVINETNNLVKNKNYLVSPLSMAYALNLLNEGANGDTKDEISKVLDDYKLPKIINVKDRIGIANLLFVKDLYKNDINSNYISTLQNKYSSDLIFDKFITPDKANEWISEKTFKMIPKAINELSKDFVLGLANAIAIDVEWRSKFECNRTTNQEFTKIDNSKMNTPMMHSKNDAYYIQNNNAKGIVKDYAIYDTTTGNISTSENENTISLEYIAIMPNSDINSYLKSFNKDELNSLLKSKKQSDEKTDISYSLPKYTYDFDYEDFGQMLSNLGINKVFSPINADLSNMKSDKSELELYVSKSIHKSHIELSENGTKAAAVTIFIVDKNSIVADEKTKIEINFDKPFIYIIKDKKSDNIWFFGTVFEPMKWEDNPNDCDIR